MEQTRRCNEIALFNDEWKLCFLRLMDLICEWQSDCTSQKMRLLFSNFTGIKMNEST
ncbi:hypothetical protein T01_2077 [Trichinella spiralis]|uniref:Uncharacterized protein n=1 Tax=Trichinella spiralis TaxID=6334 RepID=A0A0V1BJU2_TRISP|nr:hypothetical protein T01_2077 [Trichinella spiralis]